VSEGVQKSTTKYYCAINEKELNKVELAFFKRPISQTILSDQEANRIIKG
jgi:hypothetical protein